MTTIEATVRGYFDALDRVAEHGSWAIVEPHPIWVR